MTKVLLTGGSGFIAAHILDQLIQKGHKVITTVRSQDKAKKIYDAYPKLSKEQLEVAIVPDIAKSDAFDEVVKTPGIEVVLHTASPFHTKWTDAQTELIDPALIGTTGILKGIARSAPTVRRVVVTSSFAALMDEAHMEDPNTTFTEASWNPVTMAELHNSKMTAYRISKKAAEEAAWAFVKDPANGAKFDLVCINPPLVIGPVVHHLGSLEAINTSNARVVECVTGMWKNEIAATGLALNFVDVRDCATAHVQVGLEIPEAGGKRLFTTSEQQFCNRDIFNIVKKNFPEYGDKLPSDDVKGGEMPPADKHYKTDNSETTKLLGIKWTSFETTIIDTVKSLKAWGA